MLERHPFDEFHHKDGLVGILGINPRARHAALPFEPQGKTAEILKLYFEIYLLANGSVELVNDRDDVHARKHSRSGKVHQVGRTAHKLNVALHVLFDMVAANFYRHRGIALGKNGSMDLRDGSGAKRRLLDRGKNVVVAFSVEIAKTLLDVFERFRSRRASKRLQRKAVFLRKHVGTRREYLAQLDKRRTKILKKRNELLRGKTLGNLVATQDFDYLAQTGRRCGIAQSVAHKLDDVFRARHMQPLSPAASTPAIVAQRAPPYATDTAS